MAYLSSAKITADASARASIFSTALPAAAGEQMSSFYYALQQKIVDIIVAEWASLRGRPVYEPNKNNNTTHARAADAEKEIKRFGDARCEQKPPSRQLIGFHCRPTSKDHRLSPESKIALLSRGLSGAKMERP